MNHKIAHHCHNKRQRRSLMLLGLAAFIIVGQPEAAPAAADNAARDDLTQIFFAARALRQPRLIAGIPDYSSRAIDAQKQGLAELRREFDLIDPGAWPRHDQGDYLIVRSELDMLQYGLHVYRATSRSPNFYLSSISSFGMSSGATLSKFGQLVQQPPPFDESRAREILEHMRNIPRILEQAKQNLT